MAGRRLPLQSKKPLTRVSKRVLGVHGKRGLAERVGREGWQKGVGRKGLAERVGRKVGRKGWRRVGKGLAKGWQKGVGGFPCTLQFCIS